MYKKLKKLYKLPFISLLTILLIITYLIFLEYQNNSIKKQKKFLNLRILTLNSSLNEKKKKIAHLKVEYHKLKEHLEKSITPYSLKEAFKILFSDKNILILNYKYKTLKTKSLYKIVRLKLSFLTNYNKLKNYLYNLEKLGFKILEFDLKSHKYPMDTNYTILVSIKLAFYLPPKEILDDNKK